MDTQVERIASYTLFNYLNCFPLFSGFRFSLVLRPYIVVRRRCGAIDWRDYCEDSPDRAN